MTLRLPNCLAILGAAALALATACSSPTSAEPDFGFGTLSIEFNGESHKFEVEEFQVMITDVADEEKGEYPDWFEVVGEGFHLYGPIPPELSQHEDGPDNRLQGQTLTIVTTPPEYTRSLTSGLMIEGTEYPVQSGTIQLNNYKLDGDEFYKTPLKATVKLMLETSAGPRSAEGTLECNASTYY